MARGANGFAAVLEIEELPEALIGLANASYWLGDLAGVVDSVERVYVAARKRPDPVLAAAAALALVGYHKQFVGNVAAARDGWRAPLDSSTQQCRSTRGELLGARSFVTDDPVESERLAREALDIGRANGNVDLELLAMTVIGGALVQQGRTSEGVALLDEAMAAATVGGMQRPVDRSAHELHDDARVRELLRHRAGDPVGAGNGPLHRALRLPVPRRRVPDGLRPGVVRER